MAVGLYFYAMRQFLHTRFNVCKSAWFCFMVFSSSITRKEERELLFVALH